MIKPKLMLCADAVIRDAETNAISIFNIIEEIGAEALPLLIPRFVVYNLLERDDDDPVKVAATLRLTIDDESLFEQGITLNFQDKKRNRSIFTLHGLALFRPGILKVSLSVEDHELDSIFIEVIARQPTLQVSQDTDSSAA